MATLETQYKNYLDENPDSTFTFNQWKEWHGNQIEQALTKIMERSYSEEDMKNAFLDGWELRNGELPFSKAKKKWFEEIKKK